MDRFVLDSLEGVFLVDPPDKFADALCECEDCLKKNSQLVDEFAWKPHQLKDGSAGFISDGGLVRRVMPKGPEKKAASTDKPAKPDKEVSRGAVRKAIASPATLTADEVKSLPSHLANMTVVELKGLKKEIGVKGGALKAELVSKIHAHVAGKIGKPNVPKPGETKPPEVAKPKASEPPPVDLQHRDPNHPVAKEIAADKDSHEVIKSLAASFDKHQELEAKRNGLKVQIDKLRAEMPEFPVDPGPAPTTKQFKSRKAYNEAKAKWQPINDAYQKETRATIKKRFEIRDQMNSMLPELDKINAVDLPKIREEALKTLAEKMKPPVPIKVNLEHYNGPREVSGGGGFAVEAFEDTPHMRKSIDDGMSFVKSLVHDGGEHPMRIGKSATSRAYFDSNKGNTIAMGWSTFGESSERINHLSNRANSANDTTSTFVHEAGHFIEHTKPGVKEKANAFLAYRVGDEKPVDMSTVYGGETMKGEMGRSDQFERATGSKVSAYYVGKVYSDKSTEIVSMGLEQLYRDPIRFAKKDPEYCQFILSILRMPARKT